MNMKPVGEMVLVLRDKAEEKTQGGIIIAPTSTAPVFTGKVIAVGSGYLNKNGVRVERDVKEGDHVLFHRHSGSRADCISTDEDEYLLMREEDILAVLDS